MSLIDLLTENKADIVEKWIDHVLNCYPADTARIFKRQRDRFANPVGHLKKAYSNGKEISARLRFRPFQEKADHLLLLLICQ